MVDIFTLDARRILGVRGVDDGDNTVEDAGVTINNLVGLGDTDNNEIIGIAVGSVTVNGTLIRNKDNASSGRLSGAAHADDVVEVGSETALSYEGMFTNNAYNVDGVKNTRASYGANYGMDLVFQSPHGILLLAEDATKADGQIIAKSKTNVEFNLRSDIGAKAPVLLTLDRIDQGSVGASNTSDVVIAADGGDLVLSGDNNVQFNVPANLKNYTTDEVESLSSPVQGDAVLVTDGADGSPCLGVYVGTEWLRVEFGTAINDGA